MSAEEWQEQRGRLRYEIQQRPNDRVLQWHRNEWPALWVVIDEMVAETEEDTWIGNPEDMPIPEVPVAATFDENDELVEMEELPEIPEPGEKPEFEDGDSHVITSGPIPPPSKRKPPETYDEFTLPEEPE